MKYLLMASVFAAVALFCFSPSKTKAQQQTIEKTAQHVGEEWLALVDAGKYSESWEAAASMFKSAVSKEQWVSAVQSARTPFGKVESRKLKSATYTKSLPGAPDGEYVVLIYESKFANKEAGQETVTPMKDKDGSWRVSGYFVK